MAPNKVDEPNKTITIEQPSSTFLNYSISQGSVQNRHDLHRADSFTKGPDLGKRIVESGSEDEGHIKLDEENYKATIVRLENNDPKLLSIEMQIELKGSQLKILRNAIENNVVVGYIAWHEEQIECKEVESINEKLEENNKNYKYYPNDYIHALLSTHAYTNSKAGEEVTLDEDVNMFLNNWRVEKVYDDTNTTGYYGVIYVNDNTHQAVLASRGTEGIIKGLFSRNSDWNTNLQEIFSGRIIVGQQAQNYLATEEAVDLVKKKGYYLSLTGHSLGAWLAELGAFYCHQYFDHCDVKAVTFDSPGSKQMMEKLAPNIESRNVVDRKDIEIVTYLAAPNPVNCCNEHVGKVYRIDREMKLTPWMNSKIPTFIMKLFGGKIHGLTSIEGHMLGGILSAFDPSTGKPRENKCIRVADWPRLKYNGEVKDFASIAQQFVTGLPLGKLGKILVNRLVGDITIVSFIRLFVNIAEGKIYQEQYWEYFKHIDSEDTDDGLRLKHELSFGAKFALAGKAHYREDKDDKNILKLSRGSIDELLYDLHHSKTKLYTLKGLPKTVRKQLQDLASSFRIDEIGDKGRNHMLRPIRGDEDADLIKQRMRRLKKVIPEGTQKLRDFFSGFTSQPREVENLCNTIFSKEFSVSLAKQVISKKTTNQAENASGLSLIDGSHKIEVIQPSKPKTKYIRHSNIVPKDKDLFQQRDIGHFTSANTSKSKMANGTQTGKRRINPSLEVLKLVVTTCSTIIYLPITSKVYWYFCYKYLECAPLQIIDMSMAVGALYGNLYSLKSVYNLIDISCCHSNIGLKSGTLFQQRNVEHFYPSNICKLGITVCTMIIHLLMILSNVDIICWRFDYVTYLYFSQKALIMVGPMLLGLFLKLVCGIIDTLYQENVFNVQ